MNPDFNADNKPYSFEEPKQTKTFLDQKTSWSGNSWFVWKVTYIKWWFCWSTQVKGSLAKEDTKKNVFKKQMQARGCFDIVDMSRDVWGRKVTMPPKSGSWSPGFLLHLAILCQQWACTSWPYIAWLSSTCGDRAIERNSPKNSSWGSCGSLPHSQMQAGWWALQFLQDWTSCWLVWGLSAERPGL